MSIGSRMPGEVRRPYLECLQNGIGHIYTGVPESYPAYRVRGPIGTSSTEPILSRDRFRCRGGEGPDRGGRPRRIDRGLCPVEGEPACGGLRKKISSPPELRATHRGDSELPRAGRARRAEVLRIRPSAVQ